jgi:hypothetical protein
MEQVRAYLVGLAARIPILTVVTGYVYRAGGEYDSHYWRALGVPLMHDNRTFQDLLDSGFMAIALLCTEPFRGSSRWMWWGIGLCLFVALAWEGMVRLKRSKWLLNLNLESEKTWLSPAWSRRKRAITRVMGRFFSIIQFPHFALTALSCAILIAFLPLLGVGREGTREGFRQATLYASLAKASKDRLTDVTIAVFRLTQDQAQGEGISMGCSPDRCALMTVDGPISVPKGQVLYETRLNALLPKSCYTDEGIKRRKGAG